VREGGHGRGDYIRVAYNLGVRSRAEEDPLDALAPEHRARIVTLIAKRWSPPGEHPLARLHGTRLGDYRLLVLLGPKNNVGSRYFQLFLADASGRLGDEPLALGLHNSGPFPAYNWVELTQYRPVQRFADHFLDLAGEGLDRELFETLSELVPPGGHMMVEYDSPGQRVSERMLTRGYPPVASPLGLLMFRAGCRSYRDWYISEGGREGPRKLQCFKPLNEDIRREREAQLREDLSAFLGRLEESAHNEWFEPVGRNVREVLAALDERHTNP
jgi:hypothetical protein